MSARFFGHPESPLFGVFHAGRSKKKAPPSSGVRAAIVCPPIGQEYIRTHWSLRLLAKQLQRSGIHVLRLDYHGMGDSFGMVEQIESLSAWTQNIESAVDHLKSTTNASSVMLIGQRMGATLASKVALTRPDVNSVVLWEPVIDGLDYLDQLRAMHAQMLDLWVCPMRTPNDDRLEEILGTRYSRSLLDEIEQTRLPIDRVIQPQLVIDTAGSESLYHHPEPSLLKVVTAPDEGHWNELDLLETASLRPQTLSQLAKWVSEMFGRLERFNVLANESAKASRLANPEHEGVH